VRVVGGLGESVCGLGGLLGLLVPMLIRRRLGGVRRRGGRRCRP
jgi:hypothetical protein